jgi:hypothetical protein
MPRTGPVLPLTESPPGGHFPRRFHRHLSLSLPSSQQAARSAGRLSGWRRQRRDPAQRPAKQPARQVTLRQEQPIVIVAILLGRVSQFWSAVRHAVDQHTIQPMLGLLTTWLLGSQIVTEELGP